MYRPYLICLISLALLAAGCNYRPQSIESTSTVITAPTSLPSPTAIQALETPYALEPAAGICAGPVEGETTAIEIMPDVPSPRCLKVTPEQKLLATNNTDTAVTITIGSYQAALEPGEQALLDVRLGDVFAPGVHVLQVQPFFGPEIWMVSP